MRYPTPGEASPPPADYTAFLNDKIKLAPSLGFDVDPSEINPALKPHIKLIVPWMLNGGRRAFFGRFGMQKTTAHLECMRLVQKRTGRPTLIVLPLGARLSFFHDAAKYFTGDYAIKTNFIRNTYETVDDAINITNFESVREGKVDPSGFAGASIDEGDILKSFGGTLTFRKFMKVFETVPYRFVATATPDPNEYIELLAYAAFLDIMDVGQAKTRFFKRDSEKADKLTIHSHKEKEFWLWVASWALFLQKPSDLDPSLSDEGYDLPELDIRWHEIPADHAGFDQESDGQIKLLRGDAVGVQEASKEKRESLGARIARVREIIGEEGGNADQGAAQGVHGEVQQDASAQAVAERESKTQSRSPDTVRNRSAVSGSRESQGEAATGGEEGDAPEAALRSDPAAIRRNPRSTGRRLRHLRSDGGRPGEGKAEASFSGPLSRDEEGSRDPLSPLQLRDRAIPGQPGTDREGADLCPQQWVIWCDLNAEQSAIEDALRTDGISSSSIYGALDLDLREKLIFDWWERRTEALVSKPVMLGAGLNLQQCNRAIFSGIGFKFKDFIQAIHRIYRFGQTRRVRIDLIYTEREREIRRNLETKWQRFDEQAARMSALIREYGLAQAAIAGALVRTMGATRAEVSGERFTAVNNDCVDEARRIASDSVGLIVTSIPFSTQYEYTPSYNDFGHTDDDGHFFRQMDYLTPELLRVLQPGRIAAIHCKDRIVPGSMTGFGFQTVSPFGAKTMMHFMDHGFAYLGTKTIVTDVVRENNQTYRLGWTEQCKDGSRMGFGLPEYLHVFRKPPTDRTNGYADVPVVKSKEEYTRGRWQFDAHGFGRSSGNRFMQPGDLVGLDANLIFKRFKAHSLNDVYDFELEVALADALDANNQLPPTFMLMQPQSLHDDVWTDITRMRTLNGLQHAKGKELHLCPLQFDIVDRAIAQYTNEGDLVFDPFGGLMTVPYCAIRLKRRGYGVELSPAYWRDGVAHCQAAEREVDVPTLFDLMNSEAAE